MGFSVSLPTIGQPNSTEDVKVNNSLTTIQTWGNGNILGSDLSPSAAIAVTQLATGWGKLAVRTTSTNITANVGDLVVVTSGSPTITLPTAAANAVVGVFNNTTSSTSVARGGSAVIVGLGVYGATSFPIGGTDASVVLQSDGTSWYIVSGQQDTGWLALSLQAGYIALGAVTPAARLQGDRVQLCGLIKNNTGGTSTAGTTWATIPAACTPTIDTTYFTAGNGGASGPSPAQITTGGLLLNSININANQQMGIDAWTYRRV